MTKIRTAGPRGGILLVIGLILAGRIAGSSPVTRTLIKNARIYTLADPTVLNPGMILISGSRIEAVARSLEVPEGTAIVDLEGRTVIPGLVCPKASLLVRPGDDRLAGEEFPDSDILDGLDPFDRSASIPLESGVTTVYLSSRSHRFIGGLGAVVKWKPGSEAPFEVLKSGAGLSLRLDRPEAGRTSTLERLVQYERIRRLFLEAREYRRTWADHERNLRDLPKDAKTPDRPPRDGAKEVLLWVLDGKIPLRLEAHRPDAILAAAQLGEEFGLEITLEGGEWWPDVLPDLSKATPRLLFNPLSDPARCLLPGGPKGYAAGNLKAGEDAFFFGDGPSSRPRAFTAAGYLEQRNAGTTFALIPPDDFPRSAAGLRSYAAVLMSMGVSEADALKTITLDAARILGVSERVGSLEPGKDADFVVLDGPPLNTLTPIDQVYLGGVLAWERARR